MCIFLKLALVTLCVISAQSQNPIPTKREAGNPKHSQASNAKQPAADNQRGTEESPFFIKRIPTPSTQEEAARTAEERKEKAANDRKLVEFTRRLVIATAILAAIGFLQLIVFGWQANELRKTVRAAGEQSEAMERAISEANRSASAMEKVATHIETSAKAATESVAALRERTAQQMRAYLTIVVGNAIFQERKKNLKFEAKPFLINSGHTPAHKVTYVAKAAILPIPLPDDFDFPLPNEFIGSSVMGPQQNNVLSAVVDEFCVDAEVNDIKAGNYKALYVWGVVRYEDIFGERQTTKFCQTIVWLSNGQIFGYSTPRHNEAT